MKRSRRAPGPWLPWFAAVLLSLWPNPGRGAGERVGLVPEQVVLPAGWQPGPVEALLPADGGTRMAFVDASGREVGDLRAAVLDDVDAAWRFVRSHTMAVTGRLVEARTPWGEPAWATAAGTLLASVRGTVGFVLRVHRPAEAGQTLAVAAGLAPAFVASRWGEPPGLGTGAPDGRRGLPLTATTPQGARALHYVSEGCRVLQTRIGPRAMGEPGSTCHVVLWSIARDLAATSSRLTVQLPGPADRR